MTRADVQAAVAEAERFIARAKAMLASKPNSYQVATRDYKPEPWNGHGGSLSAATHRASLDLTRALSHMRRRGA